MKIALVTSEVTYIPHNYDRLILPLLELGAVSMLIELKNRSPDLLLKSAGLALLGVTGVARELAKNTVFTSSNKRRQACKQNNVSFVQLPHMNGAEAIELIKNHQIDLIINLRTRCIYRGDILSAPRLGCINVHHGLLPTYRGTMCDLYALYENRPAGFSIHKMEKRVDAGVIYRVQEVATGDLDYVNYLSKTNIFELNVLKNLIKEIEQLDALPGGTPNRAPEKVVHTKNPNRSVIKSMQAKGMKL